MTLTKTLASVYQEFEGDLEVRRMLLTDEMNHDIFQNQFDMLEIRSGMNIMDFGCGPGISTRDLAKRARPGMVFGIDIKDSAVEIAKLISKQEGIYNVEYAKMDASKVQVQDNTFHITFARNLLMSVPRPQKVLKEMVRVTRAGGLISIVSSDGFMSNIYPLNKDLKKHLEVLHNNQPSNIHMGRELYSRLSRLGLVNVQVHIDNFISKGPATEKEIEYWTLMYQQLEPIAEKIFGGADEFKKDRDIWFNFLKKKDRFDYFQIFHVMGRKPR